MVSRSSAARRGETRLRSALVVGQILMATVLLVSAGLLIQSFVNLTTMNKGYDESRVLALQLLFPGDYPIARKADTIDALLTRLRAHPNVESAGFSRAGVLISEEIMMGTWVPPGRSAAEMRANPTQLRLRSVSEGFLPAMGIRLLAGRDLDSARNSMAQPSIVINRSAEIELFGKDSGVGQIVTWHLDKTQIPVQVAGVAEDVRNESLEHEPVPEIFLDYRHLWNVTQRIGDPLPWQNQTALGVLSFAIRTRSAPETAIPDIVQIVRAVDANAGIDAIVPVRRLVSSSVTRQRFYAVMLAALACVAAILACIGVCGVLAYTVTLRTHEIGIRMALGAHRREVLTLVLRKGLMLTAAGIFFGLVAAAAGTRVLGGMLFGSTPLDPMTFVLVSLSFGVVALAASYVPARHATRVDPLVALRVD
jgi:putative ABC transport system permease protein